MNGPRTARELVEGVIFGGARGGGKNGNAPCLVY